MTQKYFTLNLLECIRCGSKDIDKQGYLYKQPTSMTTKNYGKYVEFTTYYQTQNIPACRNCNDGFKYWNYGNKFLIYLTSLGFTLLIVGILFLIFRFPFEVSGSLFIPGLIIAVLFLVSWKRLRGAKSNPRSYMKFDKKTGIFYVRSGNTQKWQFYHNWIESVMAVRAQEGIVCPECYTMKTDSELCEKCGAVI
ncbi:MAG: hypothetical protein ACW96X_02770 [Promethearchaeota archaeon]|jgi:hypothetical protein